MHTQKYELSEKYITENSQDIYTVSPPPHI